MAKNSGECVFVKTLTDYFVGRIVSEDALFIVLEDSAWIADLGRQGDALKNGTANEVEPIPGKNRVAMANVIHICPWVGPLPMDQK